MWGSPAGWDGVVERLGQVFTWASSHFASRPASKRMRRKRPGEMPRWLVQARSVRPGRGAPGPRRRARRSRCRRRSGRAWWSSSWADRGRRGRSAPRGGRRARATRRRRPRRRRARRRVEHAGVREVLPAPLERGGGRVDADGALRSAEGGRHGEGARVREEVGDRRARARARARAGGWPRWSRKSARREAVAEAHEQRHALLEDGERLGGGRAAHGERGGEVLAARVDEDVGLPRAHLEVDAVEAERGERVEDAIAARAVGPGPVVAVELRHEPVAVDVDREARQPVALLVHQAEGGGRPRARVGPPEAPAALQRASEGARERRRRRRRRARRGPRARARRRTRRGAGASKRTAAPASRVREREARCAWSMSRGAAAPP